MLVSAERLELLAILTHSVWQLRLLRQLHQQMFAKDILIIQKIVIVLILTDAATNNVFTQLMHHATQQQALQLLL